MSREMYSIINESTEDRYDETRYLAEAIRIARQIVETNGVGEPISIEHNGCVVRQFIRTSDGTIEEPSLG